MLDLQNVLGKCGEDGAAEKERRDVQRVRRDGQMAVQQNQIAVLRTVEHREVQIAHLDELREIGVTLPERNVLVAAVRNDVDEWLVGARWPVLLHLEETVHY